jgi:hypothetical protein
MGNRFDHRRLTTLEEQAYTEASEHFAQHLRQFSATCLAIERLERDLAKIAVAANIAASKTSLGDSTLTDLGPPWRKSVDLMDNFYLCHRADPGGTEHAIAERLPALGRSEIRSHGRNAVELLQQFVQEQRRVLEAWGQEMNAPLQEFLAQKYPGQDLSRVTSSFMLHFTRPVLPMPNQAREGKGGNSIRI